MKLRIQAQHLQPGDIVGSGERVAYIQCDGALIPKGKIRFILNKTKPYRDRCIYWGKYTMINVEREEVKV